jgi:hypothetical protein
MKYNTLELNGLKELQDRNPNTLYSPDGNRLTIVGNGFFHGQLLYDRKTQKVYGICLKEIKAGQEFLDQCEDYYIRDLARYKISADTAKEIMIKNGDYEPPNQPKEEQSK